MRKENFCLKEIFKVKCILWRKYILNTFFWKAKVNINSWLCGVIPRLWEIIGIFFPYSNPLFFQFIQLISQWIPFAFLWETRVSFQVLVKTILIHNWIKSFLGGDSWKYLHGFILLPLLYSYKNLSVKSETLY